MAVLGVSQKFQGLVFVNIDLIWFSSILCFHFCWGLARAGARPCVSLPFQIQRALGCTLVSTTACSAVAQELLTPPTGPV